MRIRQKALPHQKCAAKKLGRLRVGALYMESGTGKTRTVLELIHMRMERGKIDGALWLCACDARLKLERKIVELMGESMLEHLTICGMESLSHSLSMFLRLEKLLCQKRMMIVIDGGHLVKNPGSIRTLRIQRLSEMCRYRLLVNETPLTSGIEDMYAQWRMLDWRILGYQSFWSFSINHLDLENPEPGKRRIRNVDYLMRRIEPYTVQVLRKDCALKSEKDEFVWLFALPDEIQTYYKEAVLRLLCGQRRGNALLYRLFMACQQMVSGRMLTSIYPLRTAPMYQNPLDNPRVEALAQVMDYFQEERVLILCRFTYEAEDVMYALAALNIRGGFREYRKPAEKGTHSKDVRVLVMNRLCAEPEEEMAHRPEVIIHYSLDWDWGKRYRAQIRAREDGPKVISLIARNTIDPKIYRSLKFKQSLVEQIRSRLAELIPGEGKNDAEDLSGKERITGSL